MTRESGESLAEAYKTRTCPLHQVNDRTMTVMQSATSSPRANDRHTRRCRGLDNLPQVLVVAGSVGIVYASKVVRVGGSICKDVPHKDAVSTLPASEPYAPTYRWIVDLMIRG